MAVQKLLAVTAIVLIGAPAQSQGVSFRDDPAKVEREVLVALNGLRADPAAYSEMLRDYRASFHGKIASPAGSDIDTETVEGVVPVDDAIDFLRTQKKLGAIAPGTTLVQAARDQVADQSASGRTGHFTSTGKGPGERNFRHGGGTQVAEVIAYGASDAVEVVRELIVDDGVRDRGHRRILMAAHLKYAGVSCGPHPEFGTMCVIDMADTPNGG